MDTSLETLQLFMITKGCPLKPPLGSDLYKTALLRLSVASLCFAISPLAHLAELF